VRIQNQHYFTIMRKITNFIDVFLVEEKGQTIHLLSLNNIKIDYYRIALLGTHIHLCTLPWKHITFYHDDAKLYVR